MKDLTSILGSAPAPEETYEEETLPEIHFGAPVVDASQAPPDLRLNAHPMRLPYSDDRVNDEGIRSWMEDRRLGVGASEIASHSWGTTPVMTNVKYYALRILNFTEDVWATKTIMFEIDDCENTYTDFELHYLNRKGGYDSFTFSGKSNQTTSITKNFAKYNTRTIGTSSITHNTYAQRKRAFHTSLKDNYRLNSRLLKDFEVTALEDLFSSPEVYWKYDTNFVSVNVTGSTFEHAKSENGQVYSMELNMEVDNSDKRQW